MGLADLFRPKWKHSNDEVRLGAVKQLAAEETDALHWVATQDVDAAIRRVAVKKIQDLDVLQEISKADSDEGLRKLATERFNATLVSIALGDDAEAAKRALGRLEDARALVEIVKQAKDETIWRGALERVLDDRALIDAARNAVAAEARVAALERVSEGAVLKGFAVDSENKEMGIAALDRLHDPDWLEEIAKKGKNKAVRSRAKKRLAALTEPTPEEKAEDLERKKSRAYQTQLCHKMEGLARAKDLAQAADAVAEVAAEWSELGETEQKLADRFKRALDRFYARQEAQATRARREEEEKQRRAEERRRQEEEAERAEQQEEQGVDVEAAEDDDARARADEARERRLERDRQRAVELCESAEELVASDNTKDARIRWGGLERQRQRLQRTFDADEELRTRFENAQTAVKERLAAFEREREELAEQNLARLTETCEQLESLLEAEGRKEVESALNDAQKAFRRMGALPSRQARDDLKARYEDARKKLFVHLQELREADEWKRWSNVGHKEELCRRVEALQKEEDLKKTAHELRRLQAQWKKLGPVSRDRADDLWVRFKTACDMVYARCESHFAEIEQEREVNLRRKEELCEQVEAIADSEDWEQTAGRIKELQGEWKSVGPVPREQSEAIWKRFRAACDRFFDRRKEHYNELNAERKENLTAKLELCEEVEALADSTDWQATTEKIKGLQGMWKKIGPVPRKKSEAVWKRFRAACDLFFERREEAREGERMGAFHEREALCAELEAMANAPAAEAEQPPTEAQQRAEGDEPPVEEQERAERDEPAPESKAEGDQEVAEASQPPAGEEAARRVLEARKRWRRMGRVPRSKEDEINERFFRACSAVVAAFPAAFAGTELDPEKNRARKRELLERAEELLESLPAARSKAHAEDTEGAVDPEIAAEQLREALAANALGTNQAADFDWGAALSELRQLKSDWARVGPVPGEGEETLERRFAEIAREIADRAPEKKDEGREGDTRSKRRGRRRQREEPEGEAEAGVAEAAAAEEPEGEADGGAAEASTAEEPEGEAEAAASFDQADAETQLGESDDAQEQEGVGEPSVEREYSSSTATEAEPTVEAPIPPLLDDEEESKDRRPS